MFFKLIYLFYSVTIVCIFSPSLHPTPASPTSLPHAFFIYQNFLRPQYTMSLSGILLKT